MIDLFWQMPERLPNFLVYWFGACRLHWHWAEVNRIERYVKIRKEVKGQVQRYIVLLCVLFVGGVCVFSCYERTFKHSHWSGEEFAHPKIEKQPDQQHAYWHNMLLYLNWIIQYFYRFLSILNLYLIPQGAPVTDLYPVETTPSWNEHSTWT